MKFAILFSCSLLLFFLKSISQKAENSIDLKKSYQQDSNYINKILAIAYSIENNFPDSALTLYFKGLQLSKKILYINGEASSYKNISLLKAKKSEYEEAIVFANNGIKIIEKTNNLKETAKHYANLGTINAIFNKDEESSIYYIKAIEIYKTLKEYSLISEMYGNTATLLANQSQYKKAINYANQALQQSKVSKDTFTTAQAYANLGECYGQLNDSSNNEKYIRLAYDIANKTKNEVLKMHCSSSFANWLAENDQPDSSLKIIQETISIAKKNNYTDDLVEALSIEAWSLFQLKRIEDATTKLNVAKKLIQNNTISNITKTYYASVLFDVQKATGQYKEAVASLEWMNVLNDSLINKESNQSIENLNKQFTKIQKENNILKQEIQIKKQKNIILILILSSLLLMSLIFFYYKQLTKNKKLKKLEIENIQSENNFNSIEATLKAKLEERNRISKEIHDELGSSLTSISLLTEVLKKRLNLNINPEINKISATSTVMVDKMNEIIWALNTNNDTIQSLIAYVRKFSYTFLEVANIELEFNEHNEELNKPIEGNIRRNIYLTVKEAIHNIVKHSGAKNVIINIATKNGLLITINDNGKGINTDTISEFSNGIHNMKKRMKDIGGILTIEKKNGTLVTLNYNK